MSKKLYISISILIILIIILGVYWINVLHVAHSTFKNYSNFRGCVELIEKNDTYGKCKISNGATIKIVEFKNKWYLDGDLPYKGLNFL